MQKESALDQEKCTKPTRVGQLQSYTMAEISFVTTFCTSASTKRYDDPRTSIGCGRPRAPEATRSLCHRAKLELAAVAPGLHAGGNEEKTPAFQAHLSLKASQPHRRCSPRAVPLRGLDWKRRFNRAAGSAIQWFLACVSGATTSGRHFRRGGGN